MTVLNIQYIKRSTYLSLSFMSLLSSPSFSYDEETLQKKALQEKSVSYLEIIPKLLYDYFDTTQDEVQTDIKSSPMDKSDLNTRKKRGNTTTKKGGKLNRPVRNPFYNEPKEKVGLGATQILKDKCKADNDNLNKGFEKFGNAVVGIAKGGMKKVISDPEVINPLSDFIEWSNKQILEALK